VEPAIANSEVIADDPRPLKAAVATRPAAERADRVPPSFSNEAIGQARRLRQPAASLGDTTTSASARDEQR